MKKNMPQKTTVFFLSLSLLACSLTGGMTAAAAIRPPDVKVIYDGSHTIQASKTDFFGKNAKELMPGSRFQTELDVVNNSEDDIVVYLKATVGEDVYADYLQKNPDAPEATGKKYAEQLIREMPMTITALDRDGNEREVYYKGPASGDPQHADLTATNPGLTARYPNTEHGIVIGRLSYNAVASLTVEVQVPTTLGNAYQDTISMVQWNLVCDATLPEIIPDPSVPLTPPVSEDEIIREDDPPLIDGPQTGEQTAPVMIAVVLSALTLFGLTFLLLIKKSKKQKVK